MATIGILQQQKSFIIGVANLSAMLIQTRHTIRNEDSGLTTSGYQTNKHNIFMMVVQIMKGFHSIHMGGWSGSFA